MLVIIKGAGDIASGIATRLKRSGFDIVMTDIEKPTSIRNTVCFSQAIINKEQIVENIKAVYVNDISDVEKVIKGGNIAVLSDEKAECIKILKPSVVIDAILAKRNISTKIDDADIVIGVGPGFTAKVDCDCVIETKRGHNLGRVIYEGSASENTGIPGNIAGFTNERIIRATKDGTFHPIKHIGDLVKAGDVVALVDDEKVYSAIDGVIRGMLNDGIHVFKGMKSGDVDPRNKKEYCYTCSDKALAIAGGVLEAILVFKGK